MLFTDSGGGDFEQPEPGSYAANCYRIIDLGTQHGEYQGIPNDKHQCLISFELDEKMADGRPFAVSKFYTVSLSEKANLRKDLVGWRGRDFTEEELTGFDPKNVLGKPCMLSLIRTDKGKTKIASISRLPKGMEAPEQVNPLVFFTLQTKHLDPAFDTFSDGIKKIIVQSPEYQTLVNKPRERVADEPQGNDAYSGGAFDDSDIPF